MSAKRNNIKTVKNIFKESFLIDTVLFTRD